MANIRKPFEFAKVYRHILSLRYLIPPLGICCFLDDNSKLNCRSFAKKNSKRLTMIQVHFPIVTIEYFFNLKTVFH